MARVLKFNPGDLPFNYTSGGLLASDVVVAAGPVRVFRAIITNTNADARYLQLFDATSVPADTAVPNSVLAVAAGATAVLDFDATNRLGGKAFVNGLCWCNSSTAGAKTIGSADSFVEIQYQ